MESDCRDWHVCGRCNSGFTSIEAFLDHKKSQSCHNKDSNKDINKESDECVKNASQEEKKGVKSVSLHACTHQGCNYATRQVRDLRRHMRSHTGEKPHVCSVCDRSFARRDKLVLHQRSHYESRRRPHQCHICTYAAAEAAALAAHMRIHKDERPFKCQVCPYRARTSSQLVVHLRTHTGDSPFVCDSCSAAFKTSSDLKRHRRTHTGERPHSCPHCSMAFAVKSNLNAHVASMHNCNGRERLQKKKGDPKGLSLIDKEESRPPENLAKIQAFETSVRQKGRKCAKVTESLVGPKSLSQSSNKSDLKSVRASYVCSVCKARFVRHDSLVCHEKRHQTENSAFGLQQVETRISGVQTNQLASHFSPIPLQIVHLPETFDTLNWRP